MPLSALKVLELNTKYHLVEGLCERDLENPEGIGLDLRVGEVYSLEEKDGFLGVENRTTPEAIFIANIEKDGNKKITLKPGEYILVKTIEKITAPAEKVLYEEGEPARFLMPHVYPRSTLQNCGVALYCTKTDPGYSGQLRFGLANHGKRNFGFELGARMFNIVFFPVYGELKRAYEGQWQGGKRASINGLEKQI
jgi:deoxycytidine triphosphate deaminase